MDSNATPAPATVRLEDDWLDLIGKARKGHRMNQHALCSKAGISDLQWRELPDGDALASVARALSLDARGLLMLARGEYKPDCPTIPGLIQIPTPFPIPGFPDGTANAYLAFDPATRRAALFDGGTEPGLILEQIEKHTLRLEHIFITHTHHDHIGGLPTIHSMFPDVPVRAHKSELVSACAIADGETVEIGTLKIEARHTPGHTRGGMSYIVNGLERPLAMVGDAMFAGSAGNAPDSWAETLRMLENKIMTLPAETIICPGHGPLTTVAYEREYSPLFPNLS
ncbi:MAG: MBL fold metallo-hydrolase [Opitutales bacterium]|jgi:glyoxylase-like metal-dependent hydrolase (beta-lactamase superfamily II)